MDKRLKNIVLTSDPVKNDGSFETNSEDVVELFESFVNSFFTCSTIFSCFTAPVAETT